MNTPLKIFLKVLLAGFVAGFITLIIFKLLGLDNQIVYLFVIPIAGFLAGLRESSKD